MAGPTLTLPADLGLTARTLGPEDAPALQTLCEACADYHVLVYGAPPAPDEARNLLFELPPGKAAQDKHFWGLFTPRPRLVGAVDLVRDVRRPGEWYLGLLLLEPQARGLGHGEAVLRALEAFARDHGADALRLACAEQNLSGRKFWERHGFREDRRFPPRQLGARQTVLVEYLRALA